ncbi:MAG TPA: branched-chain amino acid ABC transporter permease [Chloroflexota bacterium]|nr:branched-chain amino acid ABC transporter permease [Chloroflexota bacterium]
MISAATLDFVFSQVLNGVAYGLLIFLLAAGLTLIFGMMDVVNLAHGSFYMVGAYIGLSTVRLTHNFWLALIVAPIVVGSLGLIVEGSLLRPLYRRIQLDQVILTFGLAYMVSDIVKWIWGADIQSIDPPPPFDGAAKVLGTVYPSYRLFVIGVGTLIAILLWGIQQRTRIGSVIRAGVADKEMASGLGVNVAAMFTGVFVFGAALAAFSGVVAGPILGLYQGMDSDTLIIALIVVVVGGLGTLTGAFWGGLLIGLADTFGKVLIPEFSLFLTFAVMAAVLLVRPSGLFGRKLA